MRNPTTPTSLPQEYKNTDAGIRRIVVLADADSKVFESCKGASSLSIRLLLSRRVLPWPPPALGKSEMREMYADGMPDCG
jgi:hypothetical protein